MASGTCSIPNIRQIQSRIQHLTMPCHFRSYLNTYLIHLSTSSLNQIGALMSFRPESVESSLNRRCKCCRTEHVDNRNPAGIRHLFFSVFLRCRTRKRIRESLRWAQLRLSLILRNCLRQAPIRCTQTSIITWKHAA
jgi:hypothetical protein